MRKLFCVYLVLALQFIIPILCSQKNAIDCVAGCQLTLRMVNFTDVAPEVRKLDKQCASILYLQSIYLCTRRYCSDSDEEVTPGFDRLNQTCITYSNIDLPSLKNISHTVSHLLNNDTDLHILQRNEVWTRIDSNDVVVPSELLFKDGYRTIVDWDNSMSTSHLYAAVLLLFWVAIILIRLAYRIFQALSQHVPRSLYIRYIRQYLILPAAFPHHYSGFGDSFNLTRWQFFILVTFALINLGLGFGFYDVFPTNLYWPDTRLQYARYIADRIGIMSIANIPLIWLFATRNNLVSYLTGWSFEAMMQFHRWVAVISTVQAIIHSIAYTVVAFLSGGWKHYQLLWLKRYWACGGLATVLMSGMVAFSIYPLFRKHLYEVFLLLHGAFAIGVFIGLWYHVEIFNGAYNGFLWPCILLWLLDRIARLTRLLRTNLPLRKTIATYHPESNIIWLKVPSSEKNPTAGSYYFLYFLNGLIGHQSHPFTLAGWEKGEDGRTQLTFAIRPYRGITSRLRNAILSNQIPDSDKIGDRRLYALAEGPYNSTCNLGIYDDITFVVGGTGVALVLSYLSGLATRSRQEDSSISSHLQQLRIIWAVREEAFFRQTFEQEMNQYLLELIEQSSHKPSIQLDIYVTTHPTSPFLPIQQQAEDIHETSELLSSRKSSLDEDNAISGPMYDARSSIEERLLPSASRGAHTDHEDIRVKVFHHCRPKLEEAIVGRNFTVQDDMSQWKRAIFACGPPSMARDTRAAVVKAVGLGYDIDFFSESYSW